MIATKAYLRDEAWKMPGSEMQVLIDCWGPLANNFGHYLRLGYEYLAAQAKAVERQRLEAIETEKRLKVEGLRTKLLTGLMSVNSDWLADEANWTRCDDLRKRVRAAATPEQLDGLTDEASALVLDVQKWREELPSVVDGDF